jgi:ankyrin repeat protein
MNLFQKKTIISTLTVLLVFNNQSSFSCSGHLDTLCAGGQRFINSGKHFARKHPILSGIAACSMVAVAIFGKQMLYKPLKPHNAHSREKLFCNGATNDADMSNLSFLLIKAIQSGDQTKVLELIALGADVNRPYVFEEATLPPLMVAILRGRDDIVRCLVEHGAEVNTQWKFMGIKITPLVASICQNNFEIMQYLVEHGADINAWRELSFFDKMPLLHCAIMLGNKRMVQYLVEHGADINALSVYNEFRKSALYVAVEFKKIDIVRYLAESGIDIDLGQIENGLLVMSPLELAIKNNDIEAVKCLIELGADVNMLTSVSESFLHDAVYHGAFEIVKLLVDVGVDIYRIDSYGNFAVDYAKREEIKRYLFSKGAMSKSDFQCLKYYDENEAIKEENRFIVMLFSAIYAGDEERVKNLIALGADVNAVLMNNNGSLESPLKLAVFCGEVAIVTLLVEAGADINKVDSYGWSILDYAKNKDVMKYLIGKGVRSKYGDVTGMLHAAIRDGKIDQVKILVELGADVNAKYDGISSLDLALSRNKIEIAKCLIEHGADVNAGTSTGWTYLHRALSDFELVKMLVEAGADINKIDKYGHFPLDRAEDEEIKDYLISRGAKSNIVVSSIEF